MAAIGRVRARSLLGATALVVAVLPAAAPAATAPDCSQMAATPAGSPLVVWCATEVRSAQTAQVVDMRLWRSTGDGRWVEARADGLVVSATPAPPQVSPRWAQDRTLYWATSGGLYTSTDLGDTFRPVSPLLLGSQHPTQRVLLRDTGSAVAAYVAGYDGHDIGFAAVSGVTVPAVGSPEEDLLFVPWADGLGMLSGDTATFPVRRVVGYLCTEALVCSVPWFGIPHANDGWSQQLAGAWRRPGAAAAEPTFVAIASGNRYASLSVWRVTPGGVARVSSLDPVIASVAGGRSAPMAELAFTGRRIVLRLISWGDTKRTAHERVYTSDDDGVSWRRVVAAATDRQYRVTGTPGWQPGTVSLSFVPAIVARGDVWLANVPDGTRYTALCSRDGGRRWRSSCS